MLIVYTRPDCHLCDDLKDELHRLKIPFEERSIVTDPHWYESYRERVPVVVTPDGAELDPPFPAARVRALGSLFS